MLNITNLDVATKSKLFDASICLDLLFKFQLIVEPAVLEP